MTAAPVFTTTRRFHAPRALTWQAWTDPALLVRWFGPKGCVGRMLTHELRPGGIWHSAMQIPGMPELWGKFIFREVAAPSRLVWVHGFSDAAGNRTRHPMSATWPLEMLTTVTFAEQGAETDVTVTWVPLDANATELATFTEALPGMNQGWGGSFEQLDALLAELQSRAA